MTPSGEVVTLMLFRSAVGGVVAPSATLLDRMHELLERNADGALGAVEREELETLAQAAQLGHLVAMALQTERKP